MLLAFPLLWAAGAVAALLYAQDRGIPSATALAVLPAFLLEVSLYFTMGVERLRLRLEKLPPAGVAMALVVAAVAPYTLASLALRNFSWHSLGVIAALAVVAAFWYVVFPHQTAVDILFLIFIAAVWLVRAIPPLYASPLAAFPLGLLGQLMWFRTGDIRDSERAPHEECRIRLLAGRLANGRSARCISPHLRRWPRQPVGRSISRVRICAMRDGRGPP